MSEHLQTPPPPTGFLQTHLERLIRPWLSWDRFIKLFKFMAVGLPAFGLAVPLNYVLVDTCHLSKALVYAVVLCIQVSINFFMCHFFVFEKNEQRSLLTKFWAFFSGIMLFRLADWGLYVFLVYTVHLHYLVAQLSIVAVFGIMKFVFAECVFGHRKSGESG